MSFDVLDELKRDPKNGMDGIDLMAVARVKVKGESAFCGACSLLVAFVNA